MKRFYISWHTGPEAVHTRCFDSQEAREKFRLRIDCKAAKVQVWEA